MFEQLIVKIGNSLDKASIPYIIIGGQAVLLYGEPRLTRDIDITLGINIDKLPELLDVIEYIGATPIPEDIETFVRETYVLPARDTISDIRMDFIFSSTTYERQAIKRANKIKIKETSINFASIEDVIIHKIFAGRPRDIEDVKSIILKNPKFNSAYIISWLKAFNATTKDKDFLKSFQDVLEEVVRQYRCLS
ncbi:nucleotidyl transferase AbiEii/AbiGii toxin family protein [candidate division WOR-3 bacterium]|nr:nucleotidyl transferase AbiEii/AbiGii toxin family protein [candidate division WOR-3 bacterium]